MGGRLVEIPYLDLDNTGDIIGLPKPATLAEPVEILRRIRLFPLRAIDVDRTKTGFSFSSLFPFSSSVSSEPSFSVSSRHFKDSDLSSIKSCIRTPACDRVFDNCIVATISAFSSPFGACLLPSFSPLVAALTSFFAVAAFCKSCEYRYRSYASSETTENCE